MAKEKFERTKPHVNVGTIGHVQQIEGPAGLTFDSAESTIDGNPPESYVLSVDAPSTSPAETATVIIPIDDEFFFRLATGPADSIDFSVDILATGVTGTTDVDVSLGILQNSEFFVAKASSTFDPPSIDGVSASWETFDVQNLAATDFEGPAGSGHPDFGQPFQFGYTFTSEASSTPLQLVLGLDNMNVEITTIPEPSSLALIVSLGAAWFWNRWRDD